LAPVTRALLALASAPPQSVSRPAPPASTVAGQVIDADTRLPVRGAFVSVAGSPDRSFLTGVDGRFAFDVPGTTVTLTAKKLGYFPAASGRTRHDSRPVAVHSTPARGRTSSY
jgi:hypothetical protein